MKNNLFRFIFVAVLSVVLIGCEKDSQSLRVGSKPFSESEILAEMIAQLAENEGIKVERSIPFGRTQNIMEAVKQDVIDVYPEYNGTSLIFLGQAPTSDGNASTETVQTLFKPLGMEMTGKFGFANDYAMVMTAERAQALGVSKLSELATLADPVNYAVDEDFVERPADGLQQLNRRYGINNSSVKTFALGTEGKDQIIFALLEGNADVGELFMTDGQIAEYGLVVLEDDLNFFPVYEVAPLVRSDTLSNISGLSTVFDKLTGAITAADMQAMNKAVDLDAQTAATVATGFLVSKGLLPEGSGSGSVDKFMVAADPATTRGSATAKALRAIRVGFPGNDLEISNSDNPLGLLTDGSARVGIVGAESFYSLGDAGPVPKGTAEAFAVLGYKTAHLLSSSSGGARSIGDMKKIVTGEAGSTSAVVLEMILSSLGLSGSVEVINSSDDLPNQAQGLLDNQSDGVFAMLPQGDRSLGSVLQASPISLIGLDEWSQGGHTAKFSFIRPATLPARSYPKQLRPISSVTTQTVLAGPVETVQSAGEVGPGTAGTGESTAIPISASEVEKIRAALDAGELIDPSIPVHSSLVPTIEVADKSLPFSLNISIVNILMILFTVWVLYLVTLPSPRDFTMPSDDD